TRPATTPNNTARTLFEKLSQGPSDPSLHSFFNVPLQQYARRQMDPEWVLTETEKLVRHCGIIFEYLHRRFGKEGNTKNNTILLSEDLMNWLSAPAKGDYPLPITNFIWLALNFVKPFDRLYDIKNKKGIEDFYQDLAGKYYIGMELPSRLMPDAVFDYLSQTYPCHNMPPAPVMPLSRGLAHLWQEYITEIPFHPDNAMVRAHFFMRFLVFAQMTEVDLRIFSPELIAYLNAPLYKSDKDGIAATGLMFEAFRLAGLGEDPNWNNPTFVTDKIQRFFNGAFNTLMLPPAIAQHHQGIARKLGGVSDAVMLLGSDTKSHKKYILKDEAALPVDNQKAIVNVYETGEHDAAFNPITRRINHALDVAKVPRTYIMPEYEPYPDYIKLNNMENKPWGKINIIPLELDKCADVMLSQGLKYMNGRINIGYCTWETSQLPKPHKMGLHLLDEIWVPSEYVKKIFTTETNTPVHVMPYPVVAPKPSSYIGRKTYGLPDDAFVFLNVTDYLDWVSRKNPLAVVRAFQKAFPNQPNVRLVIKIRNLDKSKLPNEHIHLRHIQEIARKDDRVIVMNKEFSEGDLAALMNLSDCYVSLHRNSALGRAVMEAMTLGKPVIATNGSGSADYLNEKTAALVDATMCSTIYDNYQHLELERGHRWFDPDINVAVKQMQRMLNDKPFAQSIAKAGQDYIAAHYNPEVTGARMHARLKEIMNTANGSAA
ncbi:MAG: glycosyltransferase family 4 protein, partial [Alphaproteobacteria bacterium]|nr:glycosyltransferase family 4 protein [Alphaproteobacteria bacterium]